MLDNQVGQQLVYRVGARRARQAPISGFRSLDQLFERLAPRGVDHVRRALGRPGNVDAESLTESPHADHHVPLHGEFESVAQRPGSPHS